MATVIDPNASPQEWNGYRVPTFHGALDSHISTGEDYTTLTLADLFTMQPTDKAKGSSPAFLPSLYIDFDARNHARQREAGQFVALTADIDKGNHVPGKVQKAVKAFVGDAAYLIYSSAHARPGDMRWRVILPLDEPCGFSTWYDAQTALYAFMAAHGIECDYALARAAQPVYLPNVPQVHAKTETPLRDENGAALFYKAAATSITKPGLSLASGPVAEGVAAIRAKRAQDEREREQMRREAEQRRASMPRGDGASIIDDFNASNSVATMLELCGYEQSPRNDEDWRSPHQTGETYATRVMGSKWFSLSQSDVSAGVGHACRDGCFGDAYDLFVHYKHGGDHKAAYRQLGEERRGHNVVPFPTPEPPEWMAEIPAYEAPPEWVDPDAEVVVDLPALPPEDSGTFALLDMDELEALPPPAWLVHELVVEDGLTVIYGDPGSGKSFIGLDMSLRIALGMDWHGAATQQAGVLYIAGEGARGLGKRVRGWRKEHGMEGVSAPFLLLPLPVAMLQPDARAKLLRTIDEATRRAGFPIRLTVIDTVSRSLAGAGENGADEMGAFVAACDIVRQHTGGAVLGVHHSGKDKEKGMRGSTVLLGACDGTIRVTKDGDLVTLKTEKQKDAEEAAPIYMRMKKVSWQVQGDEWQTTLVPFRTCDKPVNREEMTTEQIGKAFEILNHAWNSGKPLSTAPQVKNQGRYAPSILSKALECSEKLAAEYLTAWLENDCIRIEELSSHDKLKGLRVITSVIPGGAK